MGLSRKREFYNKDMKRWLVDNGTDIYSTYNEGKSVIAERFIRTLLGFIRTCSFKRCLLRCFR